MSSTQEVSEEGQTRTEDPVEKPKTKKKVIKKLPRKKKLPEGYLPLDPSRVTFEDGVPQLDGVSEKIDLANPQTDFEGVIQFIEGSVEWGDEKRTPLPQFKAIIKRGDKLTLENGSYLKIITQKRCVAVVYGPGFLLAPKSNDVSVWETSGASIRWICPPNREEKLTIDGKALTLFGGEIFYHKNKLLFRNGEGQAQSGRLEPTNLYKPKEAHWVILKNQPHMHELWKFNQELPSPKESLAFNEPSKPSNYHLQLGLVAGGSGVEHDSQLIREQTADGVKGGRLQYYLHRKKHTYFLALGFVDQEHDKEYYNQPREGDAEFNYFTLSFGERFQRERDWSWYYRVGIGEAELSFGQGIQNCGGGGPCYYHGTVKYNIFTAGLGVDKIFRFSSWMGLLLSGELQHLFNFAGPFPKDNFDYANTSVDDDVRKSDISATGLLLFVGPIFYF